MPTKTKTNKSTTRSTKSNVATSLALNKKVAFDWKIVALIGLVLVALLGYLYVRLSRAATAAHKTWYVADFQSFGAAGGSRATTAESYPANAWYNSSSDLAGFRIPHANLGAGKYCLFYPDMRMGGGSPSSTLKVYGLNSSQKTVVASAANQQCITVPADTATYPNREFEFSVTGGSASIGDVTFIPSAAASGKGSIWLPNQLSNYITGDNGSLVPQAPGNLPRYESTWHIWRSAAAQAGELLFVKFPTDDATTQEYCVEGFAPKGTSYAFDAANMGPRDVQGGYTFLTAKDGGVRYKICKSLTPAANVAEIALYMTAPPVNGDVNATTKPTGEQQITIEKIYRNNPPAAAAPAKK